MTLLATLETEVSKLSKGVRFEYATLEEANATIFDKIAAGSFPVCLVLTFDIQDTIRENGKIKSTAEINTLFLDMVPNSFDKPTYEIENEVIAPMRALTRELVNRLDLTDIVEEEGISELTNRSVHEGMTDAHLYGNWGIFTMKFSEDVTTCV